MSLIIKNEEHRPIFMNVNLSAELKQSILAFIREFKDVFAWTYVEMSGLYMQFVIHKLIIKKGLNL